MQRESRAESGFVSAGRGKWSVPTVPHAGWVCVDVEVVEDPMPTCEMCESQSIRFVHLMEHPNHPPLRVGCVCAGHMEGDVARAQARDAAMKSRSSKRARWVNRQWRTSKKGHPWIKADGFVVTVFHQGPVWTASVKRDGDDAPTFIRRPRQEMHAAMLAAFDYITGQLA
jgi:hypothetical protein